MALHGSIIQKRVEGCMGGWVADHQTLARKTIVSFGRRGTLYYSILMESKALGIKMEPNLSQADTKKRPLRTMPSTATRRVAREWVNDTQCGLGCGPPDALPAHTVYHSDTRGTLAEWLLTAWCEAVSFWCLLGSDWTAF
jgi:hypothetical protein